MSVDDEGVGLLEWLGELARRHWMLTATIAAHVVMLVFVPEVWERTVSGQSRRGIAFAMSAAARDLWIAGAGLAMYVLAGIGVPHHWAMKPPTDGEVAVARWLMRAIGVVAMWIALAITL